MSNRVTPEDLVYEVLQPADPQLSPDGSQIVYTLSGSDRDSRKTTTHLWLCDRDGGNARQLTFSGMKNEIPRWSPDGAYIAFVSDRVTAPAMAGIFVLGVAQPSEARLVTLHNQSISELAWSPDGTTLAYTTTFDPDNPTEEPVKEDDPPKVRVTRRLDYKWDGRGYLGDARNHVWLVDVASGEHRRLSEGVVDHYMPVWSPDGRSIAVGRQSSDGWNSFIAIIDVDSGELTPVGDPDVGNGSHPTAAWSPTGDRIIFAGDPGHTYQPDLFLYDVADGETRRLTNDLPVLPIEGIGSAPMTWIDERRVLLCAAEHAQHGLYVIDVETRSLDCLSRLPATLTGVSVDSARRWATHAYTAFDSPGEIAVHDLSEKTFSVITHHNTDLISRIGARDWERFEIERGGFSIESWLLKPVDFDSNRRYPVVLMIHGGPNGFFGYRFIPNQQLLANQGYLVVLPNPRGSTSYGREFSVQVLGDRGGEDYLDLMAVIDEVASRPYVDADRIGIYGYSYGGFMTSWMIGQTDRFKACVCGAPSVDLKSQFGTSDIGWHYDSTQYRAQPHENPQWFRDHSPLTYAHRATTPTLLVSGESDLRCPTSQSEELFVALCKAGCEVEFVRYPEMAHGFTSAGPAEYRVDYLTRTLDWFDQFMGQRV